MQKTWFITGAARGLGLEIAKAALRSGDRVVAAARRRETITEKLGPDSEHLLCVALDVTDAAQARAAVDAAVARFGGIDVLVNNAGYGHLGFFEEQTIADVEAQFATNLYGAFHVTWAALPVMRAARRGHVFNISSLSGLLGVDMGSLYSASKFALEGWSEALAREIAPFGLHLTIVEPGPFRTDFLTGESLRYGATQIDDYDERRTALRAGFEDRNGRQSGDPTRLADAIVKLAAGPSPPLRFIAGSQAVNAAATKFASLAQQLEVQRAAGIACDGDYDDVLLQKLG